ncbi:quinone oxidoreductase family protein [Nitrospirillum iridis]|uniref:NADPH2:quinone reductase n=1 Tax=Nitrospirillum iridis TaxID=765888 RepID=A0A7X0B623_9PROT|nr:quinone oxidoreductase [Nitrospirillum iridis]MBB6254874.1 NADPH2:quinone reductase [Nitrospirillum iridis]
MVHAIRIHQTGGPEVMKWEEVSVGEPGPGQVRLRQTAVGLNYIDVYVRTGLYKNPLPLIPGMEAAGVVEAVGPDVQDIKVGDRVGYCTGGTGGYAEARLYPADRLIHLPDGIDDQTGAAMLLQGLTAHYLLHRTFPVKPGQTILFHAAAGGVGLIACQWAKAMGATVIGTVGSDEKAELARANGCDHTIVYTRENFVERVKQITDGQGVPVVYDSIGKDTFYQSLDCLSRLGTMVSFGNASGPVGAVDIGILNTKGSLFLTRPSLGGYVATTKELRDSANDLFAAVLSNKVKIDVRQTFALKDAAQAHIALESRRTTGSTVLLP